MFRLQKPINDCTARVLTTIYFLLYLLTAVAASCSTSSSRNSDEKKRITHTASCLSHPSYPRQSQTLASGCNAKTQCIHWNIVSIFSTHFCAWVLRERITHNEKKNRKDEYKYNHSDGVEEVYRSERNERFAIIRGHTADSPPKRGITYIE